jgi:hypothetical protein
VSIKTKLFPDMSQFGEFDLTEPDEHDFTKENVTIGDLNTFQVS